VASFNDRGANQGRPSCGWTPNRQAVHCVAPYTAMSTMTKTMVIWPQRIFVANIRLLSEGMEFSEEKDADPLKFLRSHCRVPWRRNTGLAEPSETQVKLAPKARAAREWQAMRRSGRGLLPEWKRPSLDQNARGRRSDRFSGGTPTSCETCKPAAKQRCSIYGNNSAAGIIAIIPAVGLFRHRRRKSHISRRIARS
jgi:hypothetical protein